MANNGLISYWQSAAKLNLLNQRILPREQLSCARFIQISQIEKGWLDNWVGEQQDVYLAPFCFKEGSDLSIPFWLEASLLPTGELCPRKHSAFPWILPAFLDSLSSRLPILGSVHSHDALLSEYFGTPDSPKTFEKWSEYYSECLKFISELHPNWKQEFVQTGFDVFDSAIVLPLSAITTITPEPSPVLENYIQLDFVPHRSVEDVSAPILEQGLLAEGQEEAASWAKTQLIALAGLESGDCLAIEHDKDVPFQQFFTEWTRYQFVECALNRTPLPSTVIISNKNTSFDFVLPGHFAFSDTQSSRTMNQFREVFKQHFTEDQFMVEQLTPEYMSAYIHESLVFNYKQYQQGLELIQAYRHKMLQQQVEFGEEDSLEDKIQFLQSRDSSLEQRYQHLLSAQTALTSATSKTFLSQLWQKMGQSKSRHLAKCLEMVSQHVVLEEDQIARIKSSDDLLNWLGQNLRTVQVERTKLHAELIAFSEALTERQGQWTRLLAWQKQHDFAIFAEKKPLNLPSEQVVSNTLNTRFGQSIFDLANLYWQAQQHLGVIFDCEMVHQNPHETFTYDCLNKIDYVFVLQANHFSPMLGSEFCAIAERVVGFAGAKTVMAPVLTPLQDTWLTRRHQVTQQNQESILEETGALVSTGDAFQLMNVHSVYEDPTYPGMGYTQSFYLDEPVGLYPTLQASVDFHPIVGQMVPDRGSFINSPEALHLFNWIKMQPDCTNMMVVTAFAAQQYYLQSLLAESNIPVYTLREAIGKKVKSVIVSMVNASEALGPSIYDQNPLLLPEMIRMAEQKLVVFADPGIFALSHTTLGKFANKVLRCSSEQNTSHDWDSEQKKDIIFASSL